MVDVFKDIEVLESALIAFNEGASDEKYAAIYSLEKLLLEKKDQARVFEAQMDKDFEEFFSKDLDELKVTSGDEEIGSSNNKIIRTQN